MIEPLTGAAGATLTKAVEDLAGAVTALRSDLSRRTRWLWIVLAALILASAGAITYLIVVLSISISDIRQNERATCIAVQGIGEYELPPTASPLAERIVKNHASAARELGCAK